MTDLGPCPFLYSILDDYFSTKRKIYIPIHEKT
jgi:hypothetical protein